MALNTTIWGDSSTWYATVPTQGSNYPDNDKVYYAQYSILNSNVSDKFPLGEPIDKTISFSGLGAESPHSNLKWFNTELLRQQDAGTKVYTPDKQDNRSVTSFSLAFHGDSGNNSYGQNTQFLVDSDDTVRNTNPATMRWAPLPATGVYSSITPITRFNYKNFLCLIKVRAAPSLTDTYSVFDLATYCDTGHTTHPVIGSVYFVPYTKLPPNTAGDCRPAWDITGAQAGMYMSVLDSFNGLDTAPYCYNMFNSVDRQILLSGAVTQGIGTIASGYNSIDCQTSAKAYQGVCGSDAWYIYVSRKGAGTTDSNSWIEGIVARDYDEAFYEECMRAMACFGYFFTDKRSVAENFDTLGLTDPNIYCGVLDDQLVGHGDYTKGILNVRNKQWDWETSDDSTYDPSISGHSGDGGDSPYEAKVELFGGPQYTHGGNWYTWENTTVFTSLLEWCSTLTIDDTNKNQNFYGQNPINCIVSAKILFFDQMFGTSNVTPNTHIAIGSYDVTTGNTTPIANKVGAFYTDTIFCGEVTIEGHYKDFRDLEPYSSLTLLLPFAGSVNLPTDIFINHTCSLYETLDPVSGDLKYNIYVDKALYTTVTGNASLELSITGLETATYREQKYALTTQEVTHYLNAAASLVGGTSGALIASKYKNIPGAVSQILGGAINAGSGIYQGVRTHFQRNRTLAPTAILQKATGDVENGCTFFPVILHSYPRMLNDITLPEYKKRVGYATYTVGKIGEQKYVVVCESVVLSGFSCTDEEMSMIKQLLESGIYIKD